MSFAGRTKVFTLAAALAAAGFLAGCETTPDDPAPEKIGAAAASEQEVDTPETAALPPEPEIDDDPGQLIGMTPDELRALLGQPALVRRENPAQVWQYRGRSCVLDVVLYAETAGDRVTYVEARDPSGGGFETRPCLNTLLRERLATSG